MEIQMKTFTELPFESECFKMAWSEWLQYRKERKFKPYANVGLRKTFTLLLRLSNKDEKKALSIIENAMANNWQGFHQVIETQTNEQKKKDFFKKLQDFKSKNSSLYPKQLYQEFFNYWTKEDSIENKLAFEKVRIFNFEDRLKNWYEKTGKELLSKWWKESEVKQLNLSIFNAEV